MFEYNNADEECVCVSSILLCFPSIYGHSAKSKTSVSLTKDFGLCKLQVQAGRFTGVAGLDPAVNLPSPESKSA